MQIKSEPRKMEACSADLLSLSRLVRQCREETGDVRRRLQQCKGMDECRAALLRQEELLTEEVMKLVALSASLQEAAGLYAAVEDGNLGALEERPQSILPEDGVYVFDSGATIRRRIRNILNQ